MTDLQSKLQMKYQSLFQDYPRAWKLKNPLRGSCVHSDVEDFDADKPLDETVLVVLDNVDADELLGVPLDEPGEGIAVFPDGEALGPEAVDDDPRPVPLRLELLLAVFEGLVPVFEVECELLVLVDLVEESALHYHC